MPGRLLGFDIGKTSSSNSTSTSRSSHRNSFSLGQTTSTSPPRSSMDHHFTLKRPNIIRNKPSNEKEKEKDKKHGAKSPLAQAAVKHVAFDLVTESPPALLLDEPDKSTGALYSLTVNMTVNGTPITLKSVTLELQCISTTKKPVADKCPDCQRQITTVKEWKMIQGRTSFQVGKHEFPASHLIPGHLPATTRGHTCSVEYQFVAKAEADNGGPVFELKKPLEILRAVRPGAERNSVRIFPPTDLNLNVTFPSVVHRMGDFTVLAKMSGLSTSDAESFTRWRLRKVDWRIEETESSISPACLKHSAKVGGEGKGIQHEDTRIVGQDEIKQGWKSDFEGGEVEGEIICHLDASRKPANDVQSASGLKITHNLILEMIIAEEWAPLRKPKNSTPTGVARVLRTQFSITVTERAGMGIAWDDEQPPMYEDVPDSPPRYLNAELYDGDILNTDIEHLQLGT